MAATIILLNGVGSAGKSSLARAIQAQAKSPFLHVQMDSFLFMLPEAYGNDAQTFTFTTELVDGHREVAIQSGPLGQKLMTGMRHSIRALADQGLDLVVDDVLMGSGDPGVAAYRALLSPFLLLTVGVFARLDTLERRERDRGDRLIGLARWQYGRVHQGMTYDLMLESDVDGPEVMARRICAAFSL